MAKKKALHRRIIHRFHKRPLWQKITIASVIGVVLAFLGYSVFTYKTSTQETEGFFTCNKEVTVCEISQHIHANLDLTVCGKEIKLEKEEGNTTTAQHTHKEENRLHWHSRLPADPKTRLPLDTTPLTLVSTLSDLGIAFPPNCPTNRNPKTSVSVNGLPQSSGLQYVWKDGDQIVVEYN